MILVDSSVWIEYFNGLDNPHTEKLDSLLASDLLAIGDLMLVEVLQGFRQDKAFEDARRLMTSLEVVEMGGQTDRRPGGAVVSAAPLAGSNDPQDHRHRHCYSMHRGRS